MKKLLLYLLFFSSFNLAAQVPSYVPTAGLVAWYGLDNDAQDQSINGNHGTLTIAPSPDYDRHGNANGAYLFDGTQYITLPVINLPEFTINFWLKLDLSGIGLNRAVVSKHYSASTTNSGYIFMSNTGAASIPRIYYTNSSNTPYWTDGSATLDGCWHMLTGTLNSGALSFYLDGVLISSGTGGASQTNSIPTLIGAYHSNSGVPYPSLMGSLDEVGLWDNALSASVIQDLYNNSVPIASVTQTGATLTADQVGATYQWLDCDNSYAVIAAETNQSYTPSISGNYAVEVIFNGCADTSACYLVDVCTSNPITSQPTDQSATIGDDAVFSFTDTLTGATYQWQMNDGTGYTNLFNAGQYSGTDAQMLSVSAVTMGNNNSLFRCLVTESASCQDTTDAVALIVIANTSIGELDNSLVQLFPNPSNGNITFTLAQHSNGQIILTDILGKEVLSKSFTSNEVELNLKSLASKGTYFAKIIDSAGNVIAIKKLIYQ